MSSNNQINANQRNAQNSTGPRTPDGKAVVARNATSHGLAGAHIVLPGEDPAAFDALLQALRVEHAPSGPTADCIIQQLAHSHWKLLRAAGIEQQIMSVAMGEEPGETPAARLANLFLHNASPADALDRLARYEAAARRAWAIALKQLTDLHRPPAIRKVSPPDINYRTNPISLVLVKDSEPPASTPQSVSENIL